MDKEIKNNTLNDIATSLNLISKKLKTKDGLTINSSILESISISLNSISERLTNEDGLTINSNILDNISISLNSISERLTNENGLTINSNTLDNIATNLNLISQSLTTKDEIKDFLETYQIYRDHIKHEDTLGNQRLSFFIASQSFLFFPYFSVFKDYERNGYDLFDTFLLFIICVLGWGVSHLVQPSIQGFVFASHNIGLIWKKYYLKNLNQEGKEFYCVSETEPIRGWGKYLSFFDTTKPNQDTKLEDINEEIEKSTNFSFLKIQKTTIPNIRYESNYKELNDNINNLTNQIPCCFKRIWFILFLIPLIIVVLDFFFPNSVKYLKQDYTQTKKVQIEFAEELRTNIKDILNKNNTDLIDKLNNANLISADLIEKLKEEYENKEKEGITQGKQEIIEIMVKELLDKEQIETPSDFDKIINYLTELQPKQALDYIRNSNSFSDLRNELQKVSNN